MRSNSTIRLYIMHCSEYDSSTIIGLYRLSDEFGVVCSSLDSFSNLMSKQEGYKIELDISEGQELFREYMFNIERLGQKLAVRTLSRAYRSAFSRAYKVLFSEGQLCYIPEILNSAQEGFPYLQVNGEKYNFSEEVLVKGQMLIQCFYRVEQALRMYYTKVQSFVQGLDIPKEKAVIRMVLEQFDSCWTEFERRYIEELISIESQARSPMQQAITAEEQLTKFQRQQHYKGKIFLSGEEYIKLRENLCQIISFLNSVANYQGKGRDDLTVDILLRAEQILRKVTIKQSKSVRLLALNIRDCFENLRKVFRNYSQNPQLIDPQLRNNSDLVQELQKYEKNWQQGKRYFLDPVKSKQLLLFSDIIEATQQKYEQFKEMLECNDPSLFLTIPCLIVLKSLESEDSGLAREFLSDLQQTGSKHCQQYTDLKVKFLRWKEQHSSEGRYCYYNLVEASIINGNYPDDRIKEMANIIRVLAIELQRVNPVEWNNLLNVILTCEESQ